MLNTVPLDQLLAWSETPGMLPRVPSGASRGQAWSKLTREVLEALARDRDGDIRFSAHIELERRGATCETDAPGLLAQGDLF